MKHYPLIEALGWSLLHFVWQGALIGLLLWLAIALARKSSPQLRYGMSCCAMLAMVACFLITFGGRIAGSGGVEPGKQPAAIKTSPASGEPDHDMAFEASPEASATPVENPIPAKPLPARLAPQKHTQEPGSAVSGLIPKVIPPLVWVWLLGVLFFSTRLLRMWMAVRKLRSTETGSVPGEVLSNFNTLCSQLGISRTVKLLSSTIARVPMVIGWIKPVILIPAGAITGLKPAQLESVLVHELAHIRRHDYLVNLLQTIMETLFFYHPAVWWTGAQLRREREFCCDDIAVDRSTNAVEYARALASLECLRGNMPALGVAANGGSLLERIVRLTGSERRGRNPVWPVLALSLSIAVATLWNHKAEGAIADDGENNLEAIPKGMVRVRIVHGETGQPLGDTVLRYADGEKTVEVTTGKDGEALAPQYQMAMAGLQIADPTSNQSQPFKIPYYGDPTLIVDSPLNTGEWEGDIVIGRVSDDKGAPVPNARVRITARVDSPSSPQSGFIYWENGLLPNWYGPAITTDADGTFRAAIPNARQMAWWNVICEKEGFATSLITQPRLAMNLREMPEIEPVEIVLSRGVEVVARVLDSSGDPLEGYRVHSAADPLGLTSASFSGPSDSEGRLRALRAPVGTLQLARPVPEPGWEKEVIPLARLPLPFQPQEVMIPEGADEVDIEVRSLPHDLIQLEWEDLREKTRSRPTLSIEGPLNTMQARWQGALQRCDVGDGVQRLCIRTPKKLSPLFLKLAPLGNSVFYFQPKGDADPAAAYPTLKPGPSGSVSGKIIAQDGATFVMQFPPDTIKALQAEPMAIHPNGRFGQREIFGEWDENRLVFKGIYPGEDVHYSILHEAFEQLDQIEKAFAAGESRKVTIDKKAADKGSAKEGPSNLLKLEVKEMDDELRKSLNWGEAAENGLVAAMQFEPGRVNYEVGSMVKRWYYIYNSGTEPADFTIGHWQQDDMVSLKLENADGETIRPRSVLYMGATALIYTNLEPGEYVRVPSPEVYFGPEPDAAPKGSNLGTIIEGPVGTELRMSGVLRLNPGTLRVDAPEGSKPSEVWNGKLPIGALSFTIGKKRVAEGPGNEKAADAPKLDVRPMTDDLRETLNWGEAAENGLVAAMQFEPDRPRYPAGSVVKRSYFVYNSGNKPVEFSLGHWQQDDMVRLWIEGRDGERIRPKSISYRGATALLPARLNPGDYVRVPSPGVCFGPKPDPAPKGFHIGTIIEEPVGTELRMSAVLRLHLPKGKEPPEDWSERLPVCELDFLIEAPE